MAGKPKYATHEEFLAWVGHVALTTNRLLESIQGQNIRAQQLESRIVALEYVVERAKLVPKRQRKPKR